MCWNVPVTLLAEDDFASVGANYLRKEAMMSSKKDRFPRIGGDLFLTDAGIETYIMYKKGFELPNFSLFHLLNNKRATEEIAAYCRSLMDVSVRHKVGMILCGIHYRASRDWGELLGYSPASLADINRQGVELLSALKREYQSDDSPMVVSACIGPRGDAYKLNKTMGIDEAEEYHAEQISTLKSADADLVTALTFNSVAEAVGVARAAKSIDIPCVVSFTLDAKGRLKSGHSLREAILETDAATEGSIAYYMINCSHPVDFYPALEPRDWALRLNGIRPNASSLDKGILCQLGHLEEGDPVELGQQMGGISESLPHLSVWGGCCGTDAVHMEEICLNVKSARRRATAA